jgi:hypothetical protein
VTILVLLLLFAALGTAKWQYRTGLGWQIDHVVGYFGFTLMFWLAWPRPFLVGTALMGAEILLEALQSLTAGSVLRPSGRILWVAGALAAALCADLFERTRRLLNVGTFFSIQGFTVRWPWPNGARLGLRWCFGSGVARAVAPQSAALPGMGLGQCRAHFI